MGPRSATRALLGARTLRICWTARVWSCAGWSDGRPSRLMAGQNPDAERRPEAPTAPAVVTRRNVLELVAASLGAHVGTAATGVVGLAFSGCADSPSDVPDVVRTIRESFRVDMRRPDGSLLLSEGALSRLEVQVGGQTSALLARADAAAGTTHAADADVSLQGAQSYAVVLRSANGPPVPLLLGVNVPPVDAPGLASPAAAGNAPVEVVDAQDTALALLFQNPNILALDPRVAGLVRAHVEKCESFALLAGKINELRWALSEEQYEEGYSGWMRAEYVRDANGTRVPVYDLATDVPLVIDGEPQFEIAWVLDPTVQTLLAVTSLEVLRRIHSDPELESLGKFAFSAGVEDFAPPSETPFDVDEDQVSVSPYEAAVEEYGPEAPRGDTATDPPVPEFLFQHSGQERRGRTLSVEKKNGRFSLLLSNRLPIGACVGVSHLDVSGKPIGFPAGGITSTSSALAHSVSYAFGTYYPGVSRLYRPYARARLQFIVPEEAAQTLVWTRAFTSRQGDFADDGPITKSLGPSWDYSVIAQMISIGFDFAYPIFSLARGVGAAPAATLDQLKKKLTKDIWKAVALGSLPLLKAELGAILFTGSKEDIYEGLLRVGPFYAIKVLLQVARKYGIQVFAELLLFLLGITATKAVVESIIPVIGQVIKVISLAQTGIQLALAIGTFATTGQTTLSTFQRAATVRVRVTPNQSAYFPPAAVRFEGRLTTLKDDWQEGGYSKSFSGEFQTSESATTVDAGLFPIVSKLSCSLKLLDKDGRIVAFGTSEQRLEAEGGGFLFGPLPLKLVPMKTGEIRTFEHQRTLVATPNGQGVTWQVQRPIADERALSCSLVPGQLSLCGLGALSVSQEFGGLAANFSAPTGPARVVSALSLRGSLVGEPKANATEASSRTFSTWLVYGTRGSGVMITTAAKGLAVYSVNPSDTDLARFTANGNVGTPLALLSGSKVYHARIHAAERMLLAITDIGIEIASLAAPLPGSAPRTSEVRSMQGSRPGALSGPVALAPFRTEPVFALLEQGERRIQLFDLAGNPLVRNGSRQLALSLDPRREYLDLDVSFDGYLWVLSRTSSSYLLEAFDAAGILRKTFAGLPALRFALDDLNNLFTLNAQVSQRVNFPMPTLSTWFPLATAVGT